MSRPHMSDQDAVSVVLQAHQFMPSGQAHAWAVRLLADGYSVAEAISIAIEADGSGYGPDIDDASLAYFVSRPILDLEASRAPKISTAMLCTLWLVIVLAVAVSAVIIVLEAVDA